MSLPIPSSLLLAVVSLQNIILLSLLLFVGVFFLFPRHIIRPNILTYPWKMADTAEEREKDKRDVVMLAGSYNPPHYGHLAMLAYLAERYGEVIAVIGMNPSKKYDVSPMERASLLKSMLAAEEIKGSIRVEVVSGLIWRFAMKQNVKVMFRGIRSWEKDGKEESFLLFLNIGGPMILGPFKWPIPTVFLEGKTEYNHISSTLIRDLCKSSKKEKTSRDLTGLVPSKVSQDVLDAYCRNS